jgi:uncharacterized coiled-coil protein SlyX
MDTLEFPTTTKTLRHRLNEGRIPVQDGLRYAALLAEAMRKMHDEGRSHGSVTPDSIALTATGLDLLPPVPGVTRVTPYTAPEVAAERKTADARSDIFSFGAVVFETLTGRNAFDGETESAIGAAVCGSPAPPSGSPAVDRLLAGCLAKNPAERWQRVQKVQLELKLLTATARRANASAAPSRSGASDAALRAELGRFEARVNAKLQAHEQALADIQHAASEAVNTLRGQLTALGAQLAAAQEQVGRGSDPGSAMEAAADRIAARVQRSIDSLSERVAQLEQNAGAAAPDLTPYENGLEALRERIAELHTRVAADMHEFEVNLKAQSNAIDSARTAMAQTDDLLERVVEALESLQSTVLEQSEDRVTALN